MQLCQREAELRVTKELEEKTKEEIKTLKTKWEKEKEQAHAKILGVEEEHKREERLLTSAIYELGAKIIELTLDKKKTKIATVRLPSQLRSFQGNFSNLSLI